MFKVGDKVIVIQTPVNIGLPEGEIRRGMFGEIRHICGDTSPRVWFEELQLEYFVPLNCLALVDNVPVVELSTPASGTVARTIREVEFDTFHFGISSNAFFVPTCIPVEIIRQLPNDRVECYVDGIPFLIVFKRSDLEIVG